MTPTGIARLIHPGVRSVANTIAPLQARWDEHNRASLARRGPLWVAIGDSTVVGTGASSWERTAIALLLAHLRATTGEPWRLVNLGRYGVKIDTVVTTQLPRLQEWGPPQLVTVGAGSNDVIWSRGLSGLVSALDRLLDLLPAQTVVGTLPAGWFGKGLRANDWLRDQAAGRALRVAEVGIFPQPRRMVATDGLHPNDAGYRFIAQGLADAVGLGPLPAADASIPSSR